MITWSPKFETGHAIVDNDHKKLVGQLNALSEALHRGEGKEKLLEMISFLNSYARDHFTREEEHMKRVGCAAYQENCDAHDHFVLKLDNWVSRLNASGVSTSLVLEVHREACAWIQNHMAGVDCKLRGCRQA